MWFMWQSLCTSDNGDEDGEDDGGDDERLSECHNFINLLAKWCAQLLVPEPLPDSVRRPIFIVLVLVMLLHS